MTTDPHNDYTVEKNGAKSIIVAHDSSVDFTDSATEEKEALSIPDGGYGWFVVLAAFLASLLDGALPYCWGKTLLHDFTQRIVDKSVMQDYYEREVFGKSGSVTVQLSFAGTLVTAMSHLFSYPTTIIYSAIGAKKTVFIGALLASGGLLAAGSATKIWHLYLSVCICSGIGISMLLNVGYLVVPFWFDKKRNIAFGIVGGAQPFAGLVVPFIMTVINNSSLGSQWTLRILGFTFLALNALACILIKETPSAIQHREKAKLSNFDYKVFLQTNVLLFFIQGPIQLGCMYLPYTFLPSYATHLGLSTTQGSATVSIICGMGFLGRICIGLLADRLGKVNTLVCTSIISGLSCFLIWMFANNMGMLVAYSVVYGLFSGGFVTICPSTTASLVGMDHYPAAIAILVTVDGLGTLGITIASAIESVSTAEPFVTYKLMAGCGCIFGAILAFIFKLRLDRSVFSKI